MKAPLTDHDDARGSSRVIQLGCPFRLVDVDARDQHVVPTLSQGIADAAQQCKQEWLGNRLARGPVDRNHYRDGIALARLKILRRHVDRIIQPACNLDDAFAGLVIGPGTAGQCP